MKAAVVTAFSEALEIVEREVPVPTTGQVLVRLETCGLGRTDIHAAGGDWPVQPSLACGRLSLLRRRSRDPVREAAERRLLDRGRVCRVRRRQCGVVGD